MSACRTTSRSATSTWKGWDRLSKVFLPAESFARPYCPKGHYKPEVGVEDTSNSCSECRRLNNRAYQQRRRRARDRYAPPLQTATQFREVREYLGLSRRGFADLLQVDEKAIRKWENGMSRIRDTSVSRVVPIISVALRYRKAQIRQQHETRATKERHLKGA